jgi:LPXTG-motif cell wall-anchored protein
VANIRVGTMIGGTVWVVAALAGPSAGPSAEPSAAPSSSASVTATPSIKVPVTPAARRARVDAVPKVAQITTSPTPPPNDNANTGGDPTDNLPSLPGTGPNVTGLLMLSGLLLLGGISARVTARRRAE